jgi:hypothetical protein
MMRISILIRRMKEGKIYEDFRKAWHHKASALELMLT